MSRSNRPPPHTRPGTHNSSPGGASGSWVNSPSTSITSSVTNSSSTVYDTGYNTVTSLTNTVSSQQHLTQSSSVSGISSSNNNPTALGISISSPSPTTPPNFQFGSSTFSSTPQTNNNGLQATASHNLSSAPPITRATKNFMFAPPRLGGPQRHPSPTNPPPSTLFQPCSFNLGSQQPTSIGGTTPGITLGSSSLSDTKAITGGISIGTIPGSALVTMATPRTTTNSNTQTNTTIAASTLSHNTVPPGHVPVVSAAATSPPSLASLTPSLDSLSLSSTTRPRHPSTNTSSSPLPVFTEAELDSLRSLSGIISQLHTDMGACGRIKRGPPGAGSLSGSMTPSRDQFNRLKPEIETIIATRQQSTAMVKFSTLFNEFDSVLSEFVNERGYDDGYSDRVKYLERINYACGRLKGMIEAILEGIWIAGGNAPIARTLTFTETDTELPVGDELEALLSRESCYQHGEINVDLNLSSTMCSNLLQFMETDNNTDVTFCVGLQSIHAHRVVLAAQSEYFRSLLLGSMKESEPNSVIDLQDVSMATLRLLIRFAYCGCVQLKNVSLQGILNLLEAADRFSFIKLKDALISQLSSLINSDTVIQLLESAFNVNIPGLQETCFKVADDNADQLVDSDSLMTLPSEILAMILSRDTFIVSETKIYDVIKRWMSNNGSTLSQCPPELVSSVRLALMPQDSLVDLSESEEGLFTDKEILSAIKAQTKLCWERMNPRGVKASKNLFADSKCAKVINTVMWSSPTNTVTGTQLATAMALHGTAPGNIQFHGRPDGRLCSAVIYSQSTRTTGTGMLGLVQGLTTHQRLSVDIQFDHTYLINYIKFEPYPNDPGSDKRGYSYNIEVSVKGTDWKPLLDFSKYTCYHKQQLCLPTIAVKCLRFNLCSVKDSSVPFKLTFVECSFREQLKPIPCVIRDNIIAMPGNFVKCQFSEEWYLSEHGDHACSVTLRMPTFAKHLKLKLKGTCATNAVGDVMVGINSTETTSKTVQNVLLNSPDESSGIIAVSLPLDTVVCSVTVKIVNVVQMGALTTPPSSSSTAGGTIPTTYSISMFQLKVE